MAKYANDDIMDGGLNVIRTNAARMVVCSAQPNTFAEANATLALAAVAMTLADFTLGNGTTSGRKIAVAAKAGIAVSVAGTANHVALVDVVNSRLLYVTTCPSQAVSSGGTVDTTTWDIEIGDPV